jgi:hypothetical protein
MIQQFRQLSISLKHQQPNYPYVSQVLGADQPGMCGYFPAVFRVGSFVTLAYKIRGASKLVPQNFRAFFSSLYHHKKSGKQILSPAIETQFDQTLNTRSVSIGCARWKTSFNSFLY